jgi:hypothetical protein
VISDRTLSALAERLTEVPGVIGVVLGGSRAAGTHTSESDVDIGLYYRRSLDVDALGRLAREVAGKGATVSAIGGWGPWVDGGGWLTVDETPVDWIYRDVDRVRTCWQRAQEGRFEFHFQVGHPFGVPDFAYPGELALAVTLADPTGELTPLQAETRRYPEALAHALVDRLWEADFVIMGARKALPRSDTAYAAGCLFRAVLLCAHALHAHAGRWLVNEKGAVRAAGNLPNAPADFESRAHGLMANLGVAASDLNKAIDRAAALTADVRAACQGQGNLTGSVGT